MPEILYRLCQRQQIPPEDLTRCDFWKEFKKTVEVDGGGFRYLARWPDGFQKEGMIHVDESGEIEQVFSITK
jgi:hypothetical protein